MASWLLVAGVVALGIGPALSQVRPESQMWRGLLDGLSLVLVAGLCFVHLVPHALLHAGPIAAIAVVASVAAPSLFRALWPASWWDGAAIGVLAAHASIDGAALAVVGEAAGFPLAVAVVAHRIPVGLAVVQGAVTPLRGWLVVGLLAVSTVVGFAMGMPLAELGHGAMGGVLEAIVAGALLHVVWEGHDDELPSGVIEDGCVQVHEDCASHHGHAGEGCAVDSHGHLDECCVGHAPHVQVDPGVDARRIGAVVGALVGLLGLAYLVSGAEGSSSFRHVSHVGQVLTTLVLQSAPALLLGYGLAGLVTAFSGWIDLRRLAVWGRARQALGGVVVGLPMPICSCGVLPLYEALIRRGAPLTAGLAFLVATPELGLDAVLLSLPLLGGPLTVARVLGAATSAVVVAWVVGIGVPVPEVVVADESELERGEASSIRWGAGLRYGFTELVDHTLPWIGAGLLLAALVEPLLEHELLLGVPTWLQVPLAALVGIPMYVCASGATPLVAVAVHKGLSSGAALAFLLAGPATNVTTFGVLSRMHGRTIAWRFGLAMVSTAVLLGWSVDRLEIPVPDVLHGHAPHVAGWVEWSSLVLLSGVAMASLWRLGPRGMVRQISQPLYGSARIELEAG